MLDFALENKPATLEDFKPRTEKFGGSKQPATDLLISCPLDADILAVFEPTLKSFLFSEDGLDLAGGMPLRDANAVYPLERAEEMTGAEVKIGYGLGEMIFQDAKVNQFRLTPMPGGAVVVGFRVQCKPSEQQAGKLYLLQEQPITITVEPMELPVLKAAA